MCTSRAGMQQMRNRYGVAGRVADRYLASEHVGHRRHRLEYGLRLVRPAFVVLFTLRVRTDGVPSRGDSSTPVGMTGAGWGAHRTGQRRQDAPLGMTSRRPDSDCQLQVTLMRPSEPWLQACTSGAPAISCPSCSLSACEPGQCDEGILVDYFWVGIGGCVGACARLAVGNWAGRRFGMTFPYGTFICQHHRGVSDRRDPHTPRRTDDCRPALATADRRRRTRGIHHLQQFRV